MTVNGVDYSSGRPGGAALKASGMAFAARYLSHTASKNLSLAEATDLAAHGVSAVVVWETTNNRAAAGRSAGIADAHDAVQQAAAAEMPASRPIYFAVDWDADPAVVIPYFQGVASVLGLPRVGGYGGYKVVKYLLDHGLITWAWQTAAWSGGKWDARAHIRQPGTGLRINGVSCDNDTATQTDYGQWTPGKTPQEDNVTAAEVWAEQIATSPDRGAPTAPAGVILRGTSADVKYLNGLVHQLLNQQAATAATIKTLVGLVGSSADTDAIVTAVQAAIAAAVVHVQVDVTQPEPSA